MDEYLFSYNNVQVPLKISDIFYIEKEDKYVLYHTRRGEFRERKSMKEAAAYFEPYHFLWIHSSYLVNMQYITRLESDHLILQKQQFPIARSRKQHVRDSVHTYIESH